MLRTPLSNIGRTKCARFLRADRFVTGLLGACIALTTSLPAGRAESSERRTSEPGWLPIVFATGALREKIDATPIEQRPYRPLHFYGNTVRRLHYRGTPFPTYGEVVALPGRVFSRNP